MDTETRNGKAPCVALVIIYNYRFDRNIDVLEKVYRPRFSHIFHLVPFYTGDKPNVIPVYEHSYHFQGHVAQAFPAFHRQAFTHYFFIHDDLILNPAIDERNFMAEIQLPDGHAFITRFNPHNTGKNFWIHVRTAYDWKVRQPGLNIIDELPPPDTVIQRFKRLNLPHKPLRFEQIWKKPKTLGQWADALLKRPAFCYRYLKARIRQERFHLSYPLVGAYSDIFIVPAEAMDRFRHYCGLFAASNLWVEHAIPTALVMSTDKIMVIHNHCRYRGKALWSETEKRELDRYQHSLSALLRDFPADYLFLHPVKLSAWTDDLSAANPSA
jgi:hypothetical protein